jgi:hypothetical protein
MNINQYDYKELVGYYEELLSYLQDMIPNIEDVIEQFDDKWGIMTTAKTKAKLEIAEKLKADLEQVDIL